MNDDEIWELARKPVTDFIESIKCMELSVDKLVKFYLKHSRDQSIYEQNHRPNIVVKDCVKSKILNKSQVIDTEKEETTGLRGEDEGQQILSPLASAKLELAIVFAINACYWMYLVTHGEDPAKNEISKDIERVRLFMNRAKEVEESLTETCSSAKRPKIDKAASKRLCMNNMSLKSNWA